MTATAVEFDPFSAQFFDDPSEVYRRLRDEAPVYFNERYGFYALSRFDDVVAPLPCMVVPFVSLAQPAAVRRVPGEWYGGKPHERNTGSPRTGP